MTLLNALCLWEKEITRYNVNNVHFILKEQQKAIKPVSSKLLVNVPSLNILQCWVKVRFKAYTFHCNIENKNEKNSDMKKNILVIKLLNVSE